MNQITVGVDAIGGAGHQSQKIFSWNNRNAFHVLRQDGLCPGDFIAEVFEQNADADEISFLQLFQIIESLHGLHARMG